MNRQTLSNHDIDYYHEKGFLVVRDVFARSEIQALATDVERVVSERSDTFRHSNMRVRFKTSGVDQVLEVIDPISDLSPVAKSFCHDSRITDRVGSVYGEAASLFKDKYFCKPAGTEGLALHQDWIAWPGFPESFLTVLVAIDQFSEASGATKVYPGCHKAGYLSPRDSMHHHLEHSQMAVSPECLELAPGDIALFSCYTPHYSEANRSHGTRRGYFISYNAFSEGENRWQSHYNEFHEWIRSCVPEETRSQLVFI
ncbi:MAG: phytanoyl-CoA dioxygenase family protein [Pirellula sp.]|nr:phytanoyl-CoA dioxygenase family protein [Pirellula sp.]